MHILALNPSVIPGAYERPTPHYSVKRHLNLNDCDAFLIWTSTQVVQKCCFHNQRATLQDRVARLRLRVLVMKTTLLDRLSLGPYKESVTIVQIQMPFYAVGRSFRPSGGSYAPGNTDTCFTYIVCLQIRSCLFTFYAIPIFPLFNP